MFLNESSLTLAVLFFAAYIFPSVGTTPSLEIPQVFGSPPIFSEAARLTCASTLCSSLGMCVHACAHTSPHAPSLCVVLCCEYEIGQPASALQPSRPGLTLLAAAGQPAQTHEHGAFVCALVFPFLLICLCEIISLFVLLLISGRRCVYLQTLCACLSSRLPVCSLLHFNLHTASVLLSVTQLKENRNLASPFIVSLNKEHMVQFQYRFVSSQVCTLNIIKQRKTQQAKV